MACRSNSVLREESLEAVEDQIQSELELSAVVVAGLKDVLGRQLREVWVPLGTEPLQERPDDLGNALGVERLGGLLHGEPVDVAVEQRVGARLSRP